MLRAAAAFVGNARPSQQDQAAGAAIDQPAGHFQAQAAQAAGDQIRGVVAEREGRLAGVFLGGGLDHHLADVFGPRHVPHASTTRRTPNVRSGSGSSFCSTNWGSTSPMSCSTSSGCSAIMRSRAMAWKVTPGRNSSTRFWSQRSVLPSSRKRPPVAEQRKTGGDRFPGQRVHHQVDPSPPVASRIWSLKSSDRESNTCSMPRAFRYSRLRGLPAVAKISRPEPLGDLDCGEADAAGSGVDQHPLAPPHVAQPAQGRITVRKQIGMVAASSKLRCSGLTATNWPSVRA